jgi:RNA polymerase sigma-70 factor (ECF subfamily)
MDCDDGGEARSKFPVVGRLRVAKFVRAFAPTFWAGVTVSPIEINGQPSVSLSRDGVPLAVISVAVSNHGINRVFWMMNPDKLAHTGAAGRGR